MNDFNIIFLYSCLIYKKILIYSRKKVLAREKYLKTNIYYNIITK